MTRIVTALYDTLPQAELGLAHLNSEVGVEEGEIVDRTVAGRTRLARLRLEPEERAACERELEGGGYLLIARVSKEHDPDYIVKLLKSIPLDGLGKSSDAAPAAPGRVEGFRVEDPSDARGAADTLAQAPAVKPKVGQFQAFRVEDPKAAQAAPPPQTGAAAPATRPPVGPSEGFWVEDTQSGSAVAPAAPEPTQDQIAEERIPVLEEELRIGKREVLRGGARVHAHVEEHPVRHEVELATEHTSIERRPSGRTLSEEELEQGGLLRERVIEVSEMREEAVVSKEAVVREELVVKKTIERRTEWIDETVRRTEVETERLPGAQERPAFGGFASAGAGEGDRR